MNKSKALVNFYSTALEGKFPALGELLQIYQHCSCHIGRQLLRYHIVVQQKMCQETGNDN